MMALDNSFKYRKRHTWSPVIAILDIADYQVGYVLSLPFIKIVKVRTSKIMQSPKYVTVINICGIEYHKP
jgi:hypothetical protein